MPVRWFTRHVRSAKNREIDFPEINAARFRREFCHMMSDLNYQLLEDLVVSGF